MERSRGNGLFVLIIIVGLGAAGGGVWLRRHLQARTMTRNETNAYAALRIIAIAEADFRANDRDGNGVKDFWTGDVAGLYTVTGKDGLPIHLIDREFAEADVLPLRPVAAPPKPSHGYYFRALDIDESNPDTAEKQYRQDTGGNPPSGKVHHPQAFGFCAYPAVWGVTGRYVYIINENNTIFRCTIPRTEPKNWPADQEMVKSWAHVGW